MRCQRAGCCGLVLVLAAAGGTVAAAAGPGAGLATRLDLTGPAEVVVALVVDDTRPPQEPFTVTAATLRVDGKPNGEILLLPGSGRDRYEAFAGPLGPGRHEIEVVPSGLWPAEPRLAWKSLDARAVAPGDPEHGRLRFAPVLWLRADTVGEATDVPLLAYVEEDDAEGGRRFRYTVVFSNEDGGTSTRALLARWGRTTDIELLYEVVVAPDGRIVAERFQDVDHDLRPFKGRKVGDHPVLLVATLNNVFLDRGRSGGQVALVPFVVKPDEGTRESIMDAHPWTYGIAAREMEAEGKILPGRGQKREQVVDDLRHYLYVEARLRLQRGAVAARVGLADGTSRSSHEGDARLAIVRDGWVRLAVPLGAGNVPITSVAFECLPRDDRLDEARCEIEGTRAFRLDESYHPGPNLVRPATLRLRGGQAGPLSLAPSP